MSDITDSEILKFAIYHLKMLQGVRWEPAAPEWADAQVFLQAYKEHRE